MPDDERRVPVAAIAGSEVPLKMKFSLVIPIYHNEASIPELILALEEVNQAMGGEFEAVVVVDGSPDKSLELLSKALPEAGFASQLIILSRNFGSFAAIKAGLANASGDLFGVMAADLQEPPELALQFREKLLSGQFDVVVGSRATREDPPGSRLASWLFWSFYRTLVVKEIPEGGVDVFACTREFRDRLLELEESNTTLVGLIFWLGFRRGEISYHRAKRRHGASAWSFARRFRYLLDSTFAFTDLPVRLMSAIGLGGMAISVILGSIVLVAKLTGRIAVPGYTPTVLAVMFFGGLNSLGIGLLGEYTWRTFENTKRRPGFVVVRRHSFQHEARKP